MNRLMHVSTAVTRAAGCLLTLALAFGALFPVAVLADGVSNPVPSFYQEPGISSNRSYVSQHPSELIDPFTGKLQFHTVDLFIPGNGGMDIKVQRSYSSPNDWPANGQTTAVPQGESTIAGYGWTMHYGRILAPAGTPPCATPSDSSGDPVLELPDGSRNVLYVFTGGTGYITVDRWFAFCNADTSGNVSWLVYSPNGVHYQMTYAGPQVGENGQFWSTWYTTQISDQHSNALTFTYTSPAGGLLGLDTITATDGRIVTFHYQSGLLHSVSSNTSLDSWYYQYQSMAPGYVVMTGISRPDGSFWAFNYNPNTGPGAFAISQVSYPRGATISYTYQGVTLGNGQPQSAVVSQKVATTVATGFATMPCTDCSTGTWTFTYTPASEQIQPGSSLSIVAGQPVPTLDLTTVVGPEGTHAYYHIGYNSAYSGMVCQIGTLIASGSGDGNNTGWEMLESFNLTSQKISDQSCSRPHSAISDPDVEAVLIAEHGVDANGAVTTQQYSNFDGAGNAQTVVEGPVPAGSTYSTPPSPARTTNRTFLIDTASWSIHQVQNETTTISTDPANTTYSIKRGFSPNTDDLLWETHNYVSALQPGVTTNYSYTLEGDLYTRTDANQNTTTYSNYKRGIAQTIQYPESITTTRVVDDAGNVTSETDGEKVTRYYKYDNMNRLTKITPAAGNPVTIAWTPTTRTTTRGGNTEVAAYDGFGRLLEVDDTAVNSAGPTTVTRTFRYDGAGRQIFASQPNGSIGEQTTYDVLGRVQLVCHSTTFNSNLCTSYRTYSRSNNTMRFTNERHNAYTYTYQLWGDPLNGQLIGVTAPDPSANTMITRNVAGQVTGVGLGPVLARTYNYDYRFFLQSKNDPEVGTTTFQYDNVGNATQRSVGSVGGSTTNYGYDGLNRLTSVTYQNPAAPGVNTSYYKDNQVKVVDNGFASHAYLYDLNKNLKQDTLTIGSIVYSTSYGYNANDALSTVTYPSGTVIAYQPDDFNRPTQATPFVTAATYHPSGQMKSYTRGNGVTTNIGLDTDLRPNNLQIGVYDNTGHLTTPILNSTYVYDGVGNVDSISDTVDPSYNRTMTYDSLERVHTANGTWGSGTVTYDGTGNIQSMTLGDTIRNFTYDPNNRLQKVDLSSVANGGSLPWKAFTYDTLGNVTSNALHTFTFDGASHLRALDPGTTSIGYDYDGLGQRVRESINGQTTYFVDGSTGQLLYEQTPGAGSKEYIYLNGRQVAVRTLP